MVSRAFSFGIALFPVTAPLAALAGLILSGCSTVEPVKDSLSGSFGATPAGQIRFHPNGQKAASVNYRNGKLDGKQQYFNLEGELYRQEEYSDGKAVGDWVYFPEKDSFKGPARHIRKLRAGLGVYSSPFLSKYSAEISMNINPSFELAAGGGVPRDGNGSVWGIATRSTFPNLTFSPLFGIGWSAWFHDQGDRTIIKGGWNVDLGVDYQRREGTFGIGILAGLFPFAEPYPYARWSWLFP